MRAVRANSSAVPFEWVAEREKGKNMDRLSIFCRSLAGGAIIGYRSSYCSAGGSSGKRFGPGADGERGVAG